MKMIMDMRTHYAYCANPISINPHITPGSSLSKYKREIVMTLCNYISHQTKPPPRDLNTLHSAAANYALDSQIVAVGPDQGAVLAELNQSSPRNEVVAGEQISNSGESLPHSKPRKVVLSSTPSLPDPTIRPTELNIVSTFTHLSPKASDVGKNSAC